MPDPSSFVSLPPKGVSALRKALDETRAELERETSRRQTLEGTLEERLEQGRRHLAKELHDTFGQNLTAIYLNAKYLERRLEKCGPEAVAEVSELGETIHRAVAELHGIMSRLLAGDQASSGDSSGSERVAGN